MYAWKNDSLGLSLCVLLAVPGLMVFGVASHNTLTDLDGDWTLPHSPKFDTVGFFFLRQTTEILIAYTQA